MQTLFKKMAQSGSSQPKKLTLEAGPMCFHYIIANNVAFLTLAERGYPKVTLSDLPCPRSLTTKARLAGLLSCSRPPAAMRHPPEPWSHLLSGPLQLSSSCICIVCKLACAGITTHCAL